MLDFIFYIKSEEDFEEKEFNNTNIDGDDSSEDSDNVPNSSDNDEDENNIKIYWQNEKEVFHDNQLNIVKKGKNDSALNIFIMEINDIYYFQRK